MEIVVLIARQSTVPAILIETYLFTLTRKHVADGPGGIIDAPKESYQFKHQVDMLFIGTL